MFFKTWQNSNQEKITCENSQDVFEKEIMKGPLTLPNIEMYDTL